MSEDFFGDLGKSLSRATQKAASKTSSFIEATKISAQISGEQKEIDELLMRIGEIIYREAAEGHAPENQEIAETVGDIRKRKSKVLKMKRNLAVVKGMQLCPHCHEPIPMDTSFCPKCGAEITKADVESAKKEKFRDDYDEEDVSDGASGEKSADGADTEETNGQTIVAEQEIVVEDPIEVEEDS